MAELAPKPNPSSHIEEALTHQLDIKDPSLLDVVDIDPDEERKLLWKIDLFLMPALWVLLVASYIDRSNLGNARVAGMYAALNLTDNDYYYAVVTFQVAYFISGTPSNMFLSRLRPSLYIPLLMFLWGVCSMCLAAINTKGQLWAVRFLLGVTEAGFAPGVFFLISSWYKKEEQSKRFTFFLSASILSGAFGGIIAGIIAENLDGAHGIAGWRWLFIVEGSLTVGLSLIAPFFLLDFPATSKRLTPAQRKLAVARLARESITSRNTASATKLSHWRAFVSSVTNWRLPLLVVPYMQLVGASALTYFFPYLVKGLGYTAVTAQFMTAPIFGVALAIAIPTSIVADRFPSVRNLFVSVTMGIGAIFCGVATGVLSYVPRYVFLCFINAAIWTGAPIALAYASSCLGPVDTETRAISLGIINGFSQLAQVYGSALFPSEDAPEYYKGFGTYTGLFALGCVVSLTGHFLIKRYPYKIDYE